MGSNLKIKFTKFSCLWKQSWAGVSSKSAGAGLLTEKVAGSGRRVQLTFSSHDFQLWVAINRACLLFSKHCVTSAVRPGDLFPDSVPHFEITFYFPYFYVNNLIKCVPINFGNKIDNFCSSCYFEIRISNFVDELSGARNFSNLHEMTPFSKLPCHNQMEVL